MQMTCTSKPLALPNPLLYLETLVHYLDTLIHYLLIYGFTFIVSALAACVAGAGGVRRGGECVSLSLQTVQASPKLICRYRYILYSGARDIGATLLG